MANSHAVDDGGVRYTPLTYVLRWSSILYVHHKVWLRTMYAKNVREGIDASILVKIRGTLDGKAQRKGTGKV